MNAIYLCTIAQPWIDISLKLQSDFGIEPSYFVHWESERAQFEIPSLKNSYLHAIHKAWKGIGFPEKIKPHIFDEHELVNIAQYELVALKMMDRLDPNGQSFSFNNRLDFFRELMGYWRNIITNHNISIVISPSIPHRIFDYALYVVCKTLSIDFLMFQMVPFGSNSIIINDIDVMPKLDNNFLENEISPDVLHRISVIDEGYDKAIPDYMVKHEVNNEKKNIQSAFNILKKAHKFYKVFITRPETYWVKVDKTPSETSYNWLEFYRTQLYRSQTVASLKKQYQKLVHNHPITSGKFVLLALHYQPEETSSPTGGYYADQILIVKLLNQYLPKDIGIVVKEHKSQFYSHQEGASGRTSLFYRRISQISNRISFASIDDNPFDIIDKSQAVVTISGTIGWESAIRGTPTFIFGRAWYENMPGIFKIKTAQDLINAWDKVHDENYSISRSEIISFHQALQQDFIRAKHYKSYLNNTDVTFSESVDNIVNGISKHIKKTAPTCN